MLEFITVRWKSFIFAQAMPQIASAGIHTPRVWFTVIYIDRTLFTSKLPTLYNF